MPSNVYKILVGKPEGRRTLGKPRHRWIQNIKIYLTETGFRDVNWIHVAYNREWWL
jgi:hypothetical protein